MVYKCIIVDDQLLQRDVIAMHAAKIKQLQVVAQCANGLEAHQLLSKETVDIVFSDINMPELTGLELVKSLKVSPVFIIISDYPEYAAESYNLDVIDYIVKPVTFDRLLKAVNKAIEYLEIKRQTGTPTHEPAPASGDDHFFIRESSDIVKLKFRDVVYVESMGNFSRLHMLSGKQHIALVILKNMESQLPDTIFTRIHKQYIINHEHISSIGQNSITLCEKHTIPLSQSYRQLILDKVVQQKILSRRPGDAGSTEGPESEQ